LHGALAQGARQRALMDFKVGRLAVLVATDLAARGLDIRLLPVVVNYDLPRSAVDFVHRSGRTGRAGAEGLVVNFVTPAAEAHFRLIEKRQGQRIPRERVAGFEPAPVLGGVDADVLQPPAAGPVDPDRAGGIKGRRKSRKDKLREAAAQRRTP
jgi:superfamily II DNA/RNA helicase